MGKGEVVSATGVKRESGFVYYVDKEGDVSRSARGRKGSAEKVATPGITRERGFLYFVDKEGHVARTPMNRKGRTSGTKNKSRRSG